MKFIIRYFYAPVFFVGFIYIAIFIVENEISKLALILLLLIAIALSFICERVLPFEEPWNHSKKDATRDLAHAVVNETFNLASVALIPIILHTIPLKSIWPSEWPLIIQLLIAILIADFGITLMHYFSHKIQFLWRFHSIHHSVKRMYGFNGLMKHPIHQMIELIAGTTPLLLMGIPLEIGVLLAFSVATQLLLQHSNVDIKVGHLNYIWAIAPGHRHHHSASDKHGNVNFGLFTMLWDHFLGTFVIDRQQPRDGELGIHNRPDFPNRYYSQLLEPFK